MKRKYIVLILILLFLILFFYQDPYAINDNKILSHPDLENILGCDNMGRDIFSRLVLGSFYTMLIASLSVALSVIVGTIIGSIAGYYGRSLDSIITSFIEVIIAIPSILIPLGVIIVLKTGFLSMIVAIFIIYNPRCVNMVRGLVKKEKNMEYVIAAKTYGVSNIRIIFYHILPNIMKSVLISFTTGFAGAILTEAGLGYLGLGIQPPYPTWGNILNQSQSYFLSAPWFTIAPGLAIIFTVYQMNKLEKRGKRF